MGLLHHAACCAGTPTVMTTRATSSLVSALVMVCCSKGATCLPTPASMSGSGWTISARATGCKMTFWKVRSWAGWGIEADLMSYVSVLELEGLASKTECDLFSSRCYDCLNSTAPVYLTELLKVYKPTCQLCSSSDTSILCLPFVCTQSLGQRSFSYAALSVWNSLPCEVRSSNMHLWNHIWNLTSSSYPIGCMGAVSYTHLTLPTMAVV